MHKLGASGAVFDWMRMLYREMTYVVKRGAHHSDAFTSSVGILAGDTASPGLWNIYFSDFSIRDHSDDILLNGRPVSIPCRAGG